MGDSFKELKKGDFVLINRHQFMHSYYTSYNCITKNVSTYGHVLHINGDSLLFKIADSDISIKIKKSDIDDMYIINTTEREHVSEIQDMNVNSYSDYITVWYSIDGVEVSDMFGYIVGETSTFITMRQFSDDETFIVNRKNILWIDGR